MERGHANVKGAFLAHTVGMARPGEEPVVVAYKVQAFDRARRNLLRQDTSLASMRVLTIAKSPSMAPPDGKPPVPSFRHVTIF